MSDGLVRLVFKESAGTEAATPNHNTLEISGLEEGFRPYCLARDSEGGDYYLGVVKRISDAVLPRVSSETFKLYCGKPDGLREVPVSVEGSAMVGRIDLKFQDGSGRTLSTPDFAGNSVTLLGGERSRVHRLEVVLYKSGTEAISGGKRYEVEVVAGGA